MLERSRKKQETWDLEKAEVKNYCFASVFSGMYSSLITHVRQGRMKNYLL